MGVSLWKTCEPSSDFDCDAPMVDEEQVVSVASPSSCGESPDFEADVVRVKTTRQLLLRASLSTTLTTTTATTSRRQPWVR